MVVELSGCSIAPRAQWLVFRAHFGGAGAVFAELSRLPSQGPPRCYFFPMSENNEQPQGLEVRTYFVRERNALVARADFGELYVDYYLHQSQSGRQNRPSDDTMIKEALAALTLHCASRPRNETTAWTIHFVAPLVNLFVTGDNSQGTVVGQVFTEDVKNDGRNLFMGDTVRGRSPARRSVVELKDADVFAGVERYYDQSEQRPARLFRYAEEDIVMVSAQPDCDMAWFDALNDEAVRKLDQTETLTLLEKRYYQWECGCNERRMMDVLSSVMKQDAEGLFGDESVIRMSCPRCGARYMITREAMEAHIAVK
jgi:molecular chaperone Hsp33